MPDTKQDNPDALLTPTQVAKRLNVGVDTVRRWAKDGKLHAVKLPGGGHYRYREADIQAILDGSPEAVA